MGIKNHLPQAQADYFLSCCTGHNQVTKHRQKAFSKEVYIYILNKF